MFRCRRIVRDSGQIPSLGTKVKQKSGASRLLPALTFSQERGKEIKQANQNKFRLRMFR
jgi:hypothetical protein